MNRRERDLTEGSVQEHLVALALPSALSLLFLTLYNVTDTFFAGMISTEAQAGLGVGSQVFFLVTAVGVGFRIGLAAVVGDALGQEENGEATRLATTGLALAGLFTLLAIPLSWAGLPALIEVITGDGDYRALGQGYVRWLSLAAPGFILAPTLAGVLAAQGDTATPAWAQAGATVANVALNPLLIFGIPGVWEGAGLDGIAFATISCQSGLLLWLGQQTLRSSVLRGCGREDLRFRLGPARRVLAQMGPATGILSLVVLGGALTQWLLSPYGDAPVAGYGVAFRLEQLLLLPVIGVAAATLPLTSQNVGADQLDRVRESFWRGGAMGLGIVGLGALGVWTVGPWVVAQFSEDPEVQDHALRYLQIESFVFVGFVVLSGVQNLLQGLQRPLLPALVSTWRRGVGLVAFGLIFTRWLDWGPEGVWYATAATVGTGAVFSALAGWLVARDEGISLLPWREASAPEAGELSAAAEG